MSQLEQGPMAGENPETPQPGPRYVVVALLWAVVVATLGGYGCGWAISLFGTVGTVAIWALGAVAGFVGQKITLRPSRLVGWCLVAACVVAIVLAEVYWIHWSRFQGAESWTKAFKLLPRFVREKSVAALIAAVFTCLGAISAYSQTAARYRWVKVVER